MCLFGAFAVMMLDSSICAFGCDADEVQRIRYTDAYDWIKTSSNVLSVFKTVHGLIDIQITKYF